MIDKTEIQDQFFNELKCYLNGTIENVKTLDSSKRQELIAISKQYYRYLENHKILYGKLALEVVNNEGKFGLMANSHLKHQSVFDGIKAEKIPEIREQIIISLAYNDMIMRMSKDYIIVYNQKNDYFVKNIEDYHIYVFKTLATVYAWGGLAFRELVGTGSWLRLYEEGGSDINAFTAMFKNYKESKDYSSARLMDSIKHTWTHYKSWLGLAKPYINDVPFTVSRDAISKDYLAKLYDVPENRIIEVVAPQPEVPMVAYKHYKILPATDNPINHDNSQSGTTKQLSSEMQALITSFKMPNITGPYHLEYKGIDTHLKPIDHGYMEDPSTMNNTVKYILNIHHSANKGNNNNKLNSTNTNLKEGVFYISLVSPYKTIFYGNDIDKNNATRDVNTKSIALSWFQHSEAKEWADYNSKIIQEGSNIASIGDKDGRNFVQDLWHALDKPLYFTVAYTTDELLKLGTKCAVDLLNVYGSFDTMSNGQFIDKDLSKELLADRLNIDVDRIAETDIGTYDLPVKSFVVNIDKKLIDQARAMVISSYNSPEQCRIVTKINNITVHSKATYDSLRDNKKTNVTKLVKSLLQQYQWDFKDGMLVFPKCRNYLQGLKNEYNQHQRSLFYARRDLVKNSYSFNRPSLAKNKTFDQYLMTSFGEPLNIHLWYVSTIFACKGRTRILDYNIDDNAYDEVNLVNNVIQRWNNQLDLLSTNCQLNISEISFYDHHTYNSILRTVYKTLSPFILTEKEGGPDESFQEHYELECAIDSSDVDHQRYTKAMTDHTMSSSASSAHPIGYTVLNWVQEKISQKIQNLASLASFNSFELVPIWYHSDDDSTPGKRVAIKYNDSISDTIVVNPHDLIMTHTNNLSNQNSSALNNTPLLSNASTANVSTNNTLNINGTLILANLVVRMITQVTRDTITDISGTYDTTVKNNVDYGYAHNVAYSAYIPKKQINNDISVNTSAD